MKSVRSKQITDLSERGGALVLTVVLLSGILCCIALAVDLSLLWTSSLQQYNNAEYAAETALRVFIRKRDEEHLPAQTAANEAAAEAQQVTGLNFYISRPGIAQGADFTSGKGSIAFALCTPENALPPYTCGLAPSLDKANAVRVSLNSSGSTAVGTYLRVFGLGSIDLRKGSAIAHYDTTRKDRADQGTTRLALDQFLILSPLTEWQG